MNRRMDEATRNPSPGAEGGPSSDDTVAAAADRIVPVQSVGRLGLEAAADLASGRPRSSTGNSTGGTTSGSNGDKASPETKQQDQQDEQQQQQQQQQKQQQQQQEQKEEEQTSCAATTVAPSSSSSLLQSVETTFQTSAADVLSSGHHPRHRGAEEISWLETTETSEEPPTERQREFAERRRSQETTSIYTVGAQILRDLLQEEVDEGLNPQDSGEGDLAVLQDQPARDNGRRRRRQQD